MAASGKRGIRERYGRWEYRFRVGGQDYSVLTDLRATKRNLKAAENLRAKHRQDVVQMVVPPSGPVPFNEAAEFFMHWSAMEHREHPNTARRHAVSMSSLSAYLGRRPVERITAGDMEGYKTWRRECEIKDVTIRHDLHAASCLFQLGQKYGWCSQNPIRLIDMPSDRESRNETVLSREEEERYFEAARSSRDLYDVTRLMLLQGLRPTEAMAVAKDTVDLESRTLRVVRGKSASAKRVLNLTDESSRILGRRMPGDSPWCFPGRYPNKPMTYSGLINAHNKALKSSGTLFNPYSFRHTFATRFYARTKDIEALRRILGHADLKTVMRYVHIDQEQIRKAMEQYEGSLIPLEQDPLQ
jgi:integrase/recombinase XerD